MIASQPAEQEIDEAIERLQKKMQAVSTNFELGRNRMRSSPKNGKNQARQRVGKGRLLRILCILLLLGATSFFIAQITKGYIDRIEKIINSGSSDNAQKNNSDQKRIPPSQEALAKSGEANSLPYPAKFSMQSANYDIVDSELGPVLDIVITVANTGDAAGRPQLFEIELVDDANQQLMKWPMAVSGAPIPPQQQLKYKTRLVEPPQNFKNIRVTMKK